MRLKCRIFGHKADRGGARHDGQDYWTACARCDTRLIRDIEGWREPTEHEISDHATFLAEQAAGAGRLESRAHRRVADGDDRSEHVGGRFPDGPVDLP